MSNDVQKFSIKDLRRIESEIESEIQYVSNSVQLVRAEQQATKTDAEKYALGELPKLSAKMNVLIETKFKIRAFIADFNKTNGINERTAKIAELEEKSTFIENRLVSFGRAGTTRDYNTDKVKYTPGVTTDFVDERRAEVRAIKRQIQRLKDSCNGINSNSRTEIPQDLLDVFKQYKLVD